MAEVLVEFDSEFEDPEHRLYKVRACADERADDMWEGWLEFTPLAGGIVLRTGRETTQPSRDAALYWATGLTTAYIEGAMERAMGPPLPNLRPREVYSEPAYSGPARSTPTPILDPFHVYAEGDHVLRGQLNALDEGQLRTIARAFEVADPAEVDLANRAELIALIILAAEKRRA